MTVHLKIETWSELDPEELMRRSLDIDLHLSSMADSDESAVGGVTGGAIGMGEEVSWRARHFGIWWRMTSRITALEPGRRFVDEQVRGPFERFRHEHLFETVEGRTRMLDVIDFDAPFGLIGRATERLVLGRYLERLIRTRNEHLVRG